MSGHTHSMRTEPGLPGCLLHLQGLAHHRHSVNVRFLQDIRALSPGLRELNRAAVGQARTAALPHILSRSA